MQSLTLRIFLAFWLIIGLVTAIAGFAGYGYAERMRNAIENFDLHDTVVAASSALDEGGREGLLRWLRDQPGDQPMAIRVVDAAGQELLGRDLSSRSRRMLRRYDDRRHGWHRDRGDRPNLREARPLTRLRGPDGDVYTLIAEPQRDLLPRWLGLRAGPALLLIAVALSGAVSWALARAIAQPVRSFRKATVAIADGRLDTRVAEPMRNRRDEIGLLARDLDSMASRLQAAAERQRALTRNVSHELRSPLARLRVALELARRSAGDRPEFARIDEETERLDAMIGQLLKFSRVDAAEDLAREPIQLAELLERVVDDATFECRTDGRDTLTIELDAEDDIEVIGDPAVLSSLFENILRNAIRHAPANSRVAVTVRREASGIGVRVTDEGSGVADGDLEHIFEPFFRSADAMAADQDGSGLGLAIAARAVAAHGGSIRAENPDGGGFAIQVELPLAG